MIETSNLTAETGRMPISALNLQQALDIHHALKEKVQKVIDGNINESLDITAISQDNLCAIGKWLYGEGKTLYAHLPEYESVRKAHATLHVCAGEVLTEHCIGNEDQAKQLFRTKFRSASSVNQMEFTRLFKAASR